MNMSHEIIDGVCTTLYPNTMCEETFDIMLEFIISSLLHSTGRETKDMTKIHEENDIIKRSFFYITSLYVEAARNDYNKENLEKYCMCEHIKGVRAVKIIDTYVKYKMAIQRQLEFTGNSHPHVVDVNWRLDHCMESNLQRSVRKPVYHVKLSTKKHGELENVTFTCSVQQLQDLVYKLKDAVRHVEKIANA